MKRSAAFLVFAAMTWCHGAFAQESFAPYDAFNSGTIDRTLWNSGERIRYVENGALRLGQREYGSGNSDSGTSASSWGIGVTHPLAVNEIAATIKVNALQAKSCPSNTAAGQARARILGTFFNTGTPTPGSYTGDMLAQVWVGRSSTSADRAGVLEVHGVALVCLDSGCTTWNIVGNSVPLGTVAIGQPVAVAMRWDKSAKTFYFSRPGSRFQGTVAYTDNDTNPPGAQGVNLNTRLDMPSCQSAPPPAQAVDATFDNVYVNSSAAPLAIR